MSKEQEFFVGHLVRFSVLPKHDPRSTSMDCTDIGVIVSSRAMENGHPKRERDLELFRIGMFKQGSLGSEVNTTITWIHRSEILEVLCEDLHEGQRMVQTYYRSYLPEKALDEND